MTPHHASLVIVEQALAHERPAAEELSAAASTFKLGFLQRAVSLVSAGHLTAALEELAVERPIAKAAAAWPRVVSAARAATADLPRREDVTRPLVVLGVYSGLLYLVQLGVIALLRLKVVGVFLHMLADFGQRSDGLPPIPATLFPAFLLAWTVAVLWAAGVGGRFSWRARVELARSALIGAALADSGAPADVVARWVQGDEGLRRSLDTAEPQSAIGEDLRAVGRVLAEQARLRITRFHAVFRLVAIGLLALQAGWTYVAIVRLIAAIPQGVR